MTKTVKSIVAGVIALLLCALVLYVPKDFIFARADTVVTNFDNTDIISDLTSMTIDDRAFDFNDYPLNSKGRIQLFTFVEYCYSTDTNLLGNYGLYLYVYNPAAINIDVSSSLNKVELATSYNSEGKPTNYSKLELKYCSKIMGGEHNNLFYKFKIKNTFATLQRINANPAKRQYDISSVELIATGAVNVVDCFVGLTYTFTGFAEGFGSTPRVCTGAMLETIQLDVKSTYYRAAGESSVGRHVQDQLNSVYFAVPNDKLNKYGSMSAVHVEWWEYLTKEIILLGNKTVYNKLVNYIGKRVQAYDKNAYYGLALGYEKQYIHGGLDYYEYVDKLYNSRYPSFLGQCEKLDTLFYLFSTDGVKAKDYVLPSNKLRKYIEDYSNTYGNKTINGKYSADLFYNAVDEGRTVGYNDFTVYADDEYMLTSYVLSQTWWQSFFGIKNYNKLSFDGIKGIYEVTSRDFLLKDKSAICEALYIAESDYDNFKAFYDISINNNKTVFLLRYAVTDYVSKPVLVGYDTTGMLGGIGFQDVSSDAYFAQETVFIDYDVIDVSFKKDGVITVLPVVANPIDIINEITPPVNVPENGCADLWSKIWSILVWLFNFIVKYWKPILIGIVALVVICFAARVIRFVASSFGDGKGGGG